MFVCLPVAAFVVVAAHAAPDHACWSRTPASVHAAADVVLEGTMEVLVEDRDRSSRILYFLIADHRRIPLRFARPPVNLTTGSRVRVRGRWSADGALAVSELEKL